MSEAAASVSVRDAAVGQKIIIFALLSNIGLVALSFMGGPDSAVGAIVPMLYLGLLVVMLYGCYRLGRGLGWGLVRIILCMLLLFIPLVSLIVLLVLSQRATGALQAAGYRVGLMGVPMSELRA